MKIQRSVLLYASILILGLLCSPLCVLAELELTLRNSYIEQLKNTALISVDYYVDKAHPKPNPPAKDGDMHVAGRSDDVGLPIVAEIMNAKSQVAAVKAVHQAEGTGSTIKVQGVWRLWCEHGGDSTQKQGAALQPFTTTNPDHVFEIHPVTAIGSKSLLSSLQPIPGFETKDASAAFHRYENTRCRITPGTDTTTIETTMVGYNYVEFWLELDAIFPAEEDHTFVKGSVHSEEGELLVRNRRFVFIKDSAPEVALRSHKPSDTLHVLGIPRIDLALVAARVKGAKDKPEMLTWNLPYEIVIVGIYPP